MNDKEEQNKHPFIREKIKGKPYNKKKIITGVFMALVFGVIFGAAAAFTSSLLTPIFNEASSRNDTFKFPEEDSVSADAESSDAAKSDADDMTRDTNTSAVEEKELGAEDLQKIQDILYGIGDDAASSIVSVVAVSSDTDIFDTTYESTSRTSGVVIGENKKRFLILTRYSVISQAEEIHVAFSDAAPINAKIAGYDKYTDLAIVRVAKSDISDETLNAVEIARLGNSYVVERGDLVVAAGSPMGSVYSVLAGTITATDGEYSNTDCVYSVLSTDMPGMDTASGILLNLKGEVVGVVLPGSLYEGGSTLNAISVSEIKSLIETLSNGENSPHMGVTISTVTEEMSDEYGLPGGVYIKSIGENSPALSAGIQVGDVITDMNGKKVTSAEDFMTQMKACSSEQTISVTLKRPTGNSYTVVETKVELTGTL